jgi:hypothetical protein
MKLTSTKPSARLARERDAPRACEPMQPTSELNNRYCSNKHTHSEPTRTYLLKTALPSCSPCPPPSQKAIPPCSLLFLASLPPVCFLLPLEEVV